MLHKQIDIIIYYLLEKNSNKYNKYYHQHTYTMSLLCKYIVLYDCKSKQDIEYKFYVNWMYSMIGKL